MINHDEYGRAYVETKFEADKYRIADRRPTHFVKSDYLKAQYAREGRRVYTATKEGGKRYLPPAFGVAGNNNGGVVFDIDVELYGHQVEAIQYVRDAYYDGQRSAMVISGAGSGKTYTMLGIVKALSMSTVIVVPTTAIAKGVYDTFSTCVDAKIIKGSKDLKLASVNIMTHQTFNKIYDNINGHVDLLMCDEAHYCPENRIKQFCKWKGAFCCGVTATPDRKEFGEEGFQHLFKNIHDTQTQALPIKIYAHDFKYNYNRDEIMKAQEGISEGSPEIYRRLMINNDSRTDRLLSIVDKLFEKGFKNFIVFSDRVDHVKGITKKLREKYEHVYEFIGESDKESVKAEFVKHDYGIIVGNLQCCGVGFDLPCLEVGILFVSSSRTVTVEQAVGRVRRKFGTKTHGILIDFIDTFQFEGSKPKKLGFYARKKIYAEKGRDLYFIPPSLDF